MYRKVAERLFADLANGTYNPAAIISMFTDEEEQRQAAELFNTNLPQINTPQEREKAFHDYLYAVKENSFEYHSTQLSMNQLIKRKNELEELKKTRISIE